MWDKRHELIVLLSLALMAFVLRLAVFIFWIDIPGDGPMRAIISYNWSKSPYIATYGVWLPGFMYLAGVLNFLVDDPLISARILNLIIGTLTVPLFYLLLRRVHGHAVAFFSASILAFLPLHIGLSASSLTEASFLFEIIAGALLLIMASEKRKSETLYLSLSLLCLCLAVMTRYEAWLLIPLFPAYYFWKTRQFTTAIIMIVVLLIFPIGWMLGNYFYKDDLVLAFSVNKDIAAKAVGAQAVDLLGAVNIITRKSISQLGWILSVAIIVGIIVRLIRVARIEMSAENTLYDLMILIFWTFMLYFAMIRGSSFYDRFLLFGFVMALPFALLPFTRYFSNYQRWLGIIIFIAVASVGVSKFSYRPEIFVTRKQPIEIKKVAVWLQKSAYRDDPILLTKMDWQSSYLRLYFPEIESRSLIVSPWTKESRLEDFLKNQQPCCLITGDGDEEFQSRIEGHLGRKIDTARLVHREGSIKIYALKP